MQTVFALSSCVFQKNQVVYIIAYINDKLCYFVTQNNS